ncbi:MAG: RNA-directed DNA polymerase [bacterium]|nr:RNA-directed DNA polymerase [bacterium]
MIRLGFWPSERDMPTAQADDIRRTGELEREMRTIRSELSRLQNEEEMRRAIRKRRMEDARQKRKETKQRREDERKAKAEAWKKLKAKDILYLGKDVSTGLGKQENNPQRLDQYRLPHLGTAMDIAEKMEIGVGELRFLAFARKVSKTTHYQRFHIPKKNGGVRLISAPMPRLKEAQYWIMNNILQPIPLHDAAKGFRVGRSIVDNAKPHSGKDVVINIDLKDFFPTISYRRVKGVFVSLGYSEQVATIFGLLCTEPEVDEVEIDGETYYTAKGERHLPQGAPSSPVLTNIICRRLDRRLVKLAESFGLSYSRYADDITFSGSAELRDKIGVLLGKTMGIVRHEGFYIHTDKTRILHKGSKQEVTGIVVNNGLSVDRKTLRRLRATLFQMEKDGTEGKRWGNCADILASVEGYAHFVAMVDREKGNALLAKIRIIKEKAGYRKPKYKRRPKKEPGWKKSEAASPVEEKVREDAPKQEKPSTPGTPESKSWWKFW